MSYEDNMKAAHEIDESLRSIRAYSTEEIRQCRERIAELEASLSEAPRNFTLLPPDIQRLWEAIVRLSRPELLGELKGVIRYVEKLETLYREALDKLKEK